MSRVVVANTLGHPGNRVPSVVPGAVVVTWWAV